MDFAEVISDGTPSTTVKDYCDNGNMQAKGKAVNICNLMVFLKCQCNQIALLRLLKIIQSRNRKCFGSKHC